MPVEQSPSSENLKYIVSPQRHSPTPDPLVASPNPHPGMERHSQLLILKLVVKATLIFV